MSLQTLSDQVQSGWLLDGGLGPMLYHAAGRDVIDRLPSESRDLLLAADWAARIWHAGLVEATVELIDMCGELGVGVVLLKGISISEQHYPSGHLRPMTDIDILIPQAAYERVEDAMLAQGYLGPPGSNLNESSCHGIPLCHPHHRVWVELHTSLFPENSPLRSNALFSRAQLQRELVSSTFAGRNVFRLSDEMQLVYSAATWVRDMSSLDMHPSFLPPLFDAVYLLAARDRGLDWDRLLGEVDNEMAAASLLILLSYIEPHLQRVPPPVFSRLLTMQRLVQPLELRLLHRLLDRHLVAGRPKIRLFQTWHVPANLIRPGAAMGKLLRLPWNVMFPPRMPNRYRVTYHRERISRRCSELLRDLRARAAAR